VKLLQAHLNAFYTLLLLTRSAALAAAAAAAAAAAYKAVWVLKLA